MANGWDTRRAKNAATAARKAKYTSGPYLRARRYWVPIVRAGGVACWRCGGPIEPDERWHLGHDDVETEVIRGPEHPSCNVKAAARKGYRAQQEARRAALFTRAIR